MTIRSLASAALLALHVAAFSIAAGPVRAEEPTQGAEPTISMGDARRIAIDNGMVRFEEIELEDGLWELDGRDSDDGEIEIDIRATDGRVMRVERDRHDAAQIAP